MPGRSITQEVEAEFIAVNKRDCNTTSQKQEWHEEFSNEITSMLLPVPSTLLRAGRGGTKNCRQDEEEYQATMEYKFR